MLLRSQPREEILELIEAAIRPELFEKLPNGQYRLQGRDWDHSRREYRTQALRVYTALESRLRPVPA